MTMNELVQAAASGYPEQYVLLYWDAKRQCAVDKKAGDSLAKFIAWELYETFDPDTSDEEQVAVAIRVIRRAATDLQAVVGALERLAGSLN